MEMLGGGPEIASSCRKPEIVADAAYVMLTKDSRSYTGHFAIDEDVLRDVGIDDFDSYACVPGRWFISTDTLFVFWLWGCDDNNIWFIVCVYISFSNNEQSVM